MQPLTFPCPRCGKRMGVGLALAGRPVRCPHCREVVTAPAAPTAAPPAGPQPESAESILADPEESDDSLFARPDAAPPTLPPAGRLSLTPPTMMPVPTGRPLGEPPPKPNTPPNPWAGLAGSPAPPADTPPPVSRPVRRVRWRTAALLAYAVLMTALAAWGWLGSRDREHPLSAIPDVFGEYEKASRKRVSHLLPGPDVEVPPGLRVPLGRTLAVGDLEVTPITVEERRPHLYTRLEAANAEVGSRSVGPCLALWLRLRNRSADVSFHPTDPAFAGKPRRDGAVPAGVFVDGKALLGGPVDWPFAAGIRRVYLDGQEADDRPLEPGEAREYVVYSDDDPRLVPAVRSAAGPVLWKVLLRRGLVRYRFRDVSVLALVGVEFRGPEVR